ncbi:radical SAM protein [Streptomyces sp. SP17BM10]|uniref:cyclophane-forming radical SAM peptide maturase AmcB n=1 Tax=Streptomyces sp. SP17BM10 TaxID=3002530 RepID=UPI002E780A9D|nr:cyclophane-forming radical SAM peptide maturase AmcB [Streptomyces sp. SP17BM10]MEE1786874.1 radical SAM protein [Streptomyces sp. SP17BM10]
MQTLDRYRSRIARRPKVVVTQPDGFCNLKCTYCYLPDRDRRTPMPVEVAQAVARSVAEFADTISATPVEIVWHAGEPLAIGRRRFAELLAPFEPLRQAGRVEHSVQTNAVLITPAWCEFLTDYGFRVGVSIDGPAALNHQRVDWAGRPAFDRIMKGIACLREHGVRFSTIAVVSAESIGDPEGLLDFMADLGCHTVGLNMEELEGVNTDRLGPTVEQAREFWRRAIAWSRRHRGLTIREVDRLGSYLRAARAGRGAAWDELLIDPIPTVSSAGDVVLLSPELAGIGDPAYEDFRAGNVMELSIGSMLDRAHELRYVREFLTGLDECEATCEFFGFCRGAQAGNRYFENGRLDTTETNYCRVSKQALITALSDTVREEQAA